MLEAVGVEGTPEQMAEQFELQSLLNDKVKNIVGHTSLNFSPEDNERLKHDDELMLQIAHDYMKLMGIENTQYIIARHIDREHPHCHIVFNRVDNDGKTISDKNDFRRNEKVCKMLLPNIACILPMVKTISRRNDCALMTEQSMRYTKR